MVGSKIAGEVIIMHFNTVFSFVHFGAKIQNNQNLKSDDLPKKNYKKLGKNLENPQNWERFQKRSILKYWAKSSNSSKILKTEPNP